MRRGFLLLAICMAFVWMPAARAQQAAVDQRKIFSSYLSDPGYKPYLEQVFNLGEPALLKAKCQSLKMIEADRLMMIDEPKFVRASGTYVIDSGSWVAIAQMDRCGSKVIRRVLLKAVPGKNQLQPTYMLPGDFRGNLQLEVDASRIVLTGLMSATNCSDRAKVQVMDIKVRDALTPKGWSEIWTVETCGRTMDGDVNYSITPTGTSIAAGNWKDR